MFVCTYICIYYITRSASAGAPERPKPARSALAVPGPEARFVGGRRTRQA